MKKRLLVLLFFGLALVFGYAVWVQFPQVRQPEQLAAIYQSAQTRWDQTQAQAEDKTRNGYFSPSFLPYWGRKDREGKPESQARDVVRAWNDYSSPALVEKVDHPAKLDSPEYRAALANIEKLEPEMMTFTAMPVFVVPDSPPNFDTMVMNFIGVRATAHAMVGLAENRVARGKDAEAARLLDAVLVWGRTLQTGGSLIAELIGVSIQTIGADAWIGLLGPDAKLDAAQWQEAARSLSKAVPARNQIADSLETELLAVRNTITLIEEGKLSEKTSGDLFLLPLPGFPQRELRIFSNQMVQTIADLRSGQPLVFPKYMTEPGVGDYLSGKQGYMANIMTSNYPRAESVAQQNRQRVIGLALVAATRAFQAQKQRLPKTLDELVASGIATPPNLSKDDVMFSADKKGVSFELAYLKNPNLESPGTNLFGQREWADEATMGKLIFRVASKAR